MIRIKHQTHQVKYQKGYERMDELKKAILGFLNVRSHSLNSLHQCISYSNTSELLLALEELEKEDKIIIVPADTNQFMSEIRYRLK